MCEFEKFYKTNINRNILLLKRESLMISLTYHLQNLDQNMHIKSHTKIIQEITSEN